MSGVFGPPGPRVRHGAMRETPGPGFDSAPIHLHRTAERSVWGKMKRWRAVAVVSRTLWRSQSITNLSIPRFSGNYSSTK